MDRSASPFLDLIFSYFEPSIHLGVDIQGDLTPGGAGGLEPEDETDLIKECGLLSSALGLPRSFSASDLVLGNNVGANKGGLGSGGTSLLFLPGGGRGSRLIDQELRYPLRLAASEVSTRRDSSVTLIVLSTITTLFGTI